MEDRDSEGLGKKGAANMLHPFFIDYGYTMMTNKKLLEYKSVEVLE